MTSNLLNVGQRLTIPKAPVAPKPEEYTTYTVRKGDSLYSIAKEFNTTVDKLIEFNQLSSSNLSIGQKILIPLGTQESPPVKNYYIVKAGDSLYSIANRYDTTVDEIIKLNNLTTTVLQIGDKLIVPNYSNIPESGTITPGENTYIVQGGDSLYSIANKFNTTVTDLKNLNNLSSNLLSIGQVLIIPSTSKNQTYYVQSGDSLYSIARRFNATVDEIKKLNNLTSELLSIGQVLLIPV